MDTSARSNPILVTGAHRSGTTWVGKMLAAGGGLAYVSEPLNVLHRPGVMRAAVAHWYQYISDGNQADYLEALRDTVALRYQYGRELAALRAPKDLLRMGRDAYIFTRGRLRNQPALLKDPFAVMSAPWFADRLDCRVVVVVRHPAGFVSSLQRLNWTFNFQHLRAQPALMDALLGAWRDQMQAADSNPHDLIGRASLLWDIIYTIVDGYRASQPDFIIVRHEDLSRHPLAGFEDLYNQLGLAFNPRARARIQRASSTGNPSETANRAKHSVDLDSRANIKNWQSHLTPAEIARIRTLTETVAPRFYGDEDWE